MFDVEKQPVQTKTRRKLKAELTSCTVNHTELYADIFERSLSYALSQMFC